MLPAYRTILAPNRPDLPFAVDYCNSNLRACYVSPAVDFGSILSLRTGTVLNSYSWSFIDHPTILDPQIGQYWNSVLFRSVCIRRPGIP